MIPFIIISVISIAYAIIRAFHDSKLSNGKWKTWAFIEGILIDLSIVVLTILWFHMQWWFIFPLGMIFALIFWLFFDCTEGYLRTGSILYIGEYGFDLKMRKTFKYDLLIFGWKSKSLIYVIFKLFWLGLFIPAYFSLFNYYWIGVLIPITAILFRKKTSNLE